LVFISALARLVRFWYLTKREEYKDFSNLLTAEQRNNVRKKMYATFSKSNISLSSFFQFQFVAHSNVQQLLASIWYEGLPGFRRKNMALQALEIIRIGERDTFVILFR
jgi:hypothetical protein